MTLSKFVSLSLLATTLAAPFTPANPILAARADLDPKCAAPGGNFKLDSWTLQLPIPDKNGNPQQKSSDELKGCSSYKSEWFSTSTKDGSMVLKVPPKDGGCVTTEHSQHCRTELREQPGGWSPKASKNRLRVTVSVPEPDDSDLGTVVGQIHVDEKKDPSKSTKPVCELYYNKKGELVLGVQQIPKQSSQKVSKVLKTFKVGEKFEYEIRYEKGKLLVGFNTKGEEDAKMTELETGSLNGPLSYFKAGNYNQGQTKSEVHVYEINVTHEK